MRLIDADFTEEYISKYREYKGKPLTDEQKELIRDIAFTIAELQPTAYDIEEKVRQMKSEPHKEIDINETN